MATIKSYTDLSQSKTLSKILPLESADMHLTNSSTKGEMYTDEFKPSVVPYLRAKDSLDAYSKIVNNMIAWEVIPCWSLAALLDVIPKRIKDYNVLRIDNNNNDFSIWYDEIGFGVNNDLPNITMESAVDACVAMIEKLHELNLL